MYVEVCIVKCLYLFYFGRYSHLNELSAILDQFSTSLTMFCGRHRRDKPFKASPKCPPTQSNIVYRMLIILIIVSLENQIA